jgi:hypothetical protein
VLLLLHVLASGGVAVYFATRSSAPAVPVAHDAAAAVPMADATPPIVIAVDAAQQPPPDAAEVAPIDAGRPRPPRDGGRARADAAVMPMAADAAVGTGYLKALHAGSRYLDVIVDGKKIGPTPIYKPRPVPAGPHTVDLVEPSTGEVIVHKQIHIVPDQTVTVQE